MSNQLFFLSATVELPISRPPEEARRGRVGHIALGRTKMHMHPAGRIEGNVCKREAGQDWSLDQLLHT